MPINWQNQKKQISELIPADYNPRRLTDSQRNQLKKSLEKFNLADPLILNTDNTLIGGHQRLKVLLELGYTEIDVRVPDRPLTKDEEKELNLRLNKNQGEWDNELLLDFSNDLLLSVGFTEDELNLYKNGDDEGGFDKLTDQEKSELEQVTFTLDKPQMEILKEALNLSLENFKDLDVGSTIKRAMAITEICKLHLSK
jgi:hypothetical protein